MLDVVRLTIAYKGRKAEEKEEGRRRVEEGRTGGGKGQEQAISMQKHISGLATYLHGHRLTAHKQTG